MTYEEYITRLTNIRKEINLLINDLDSTYSNAPEMLEKVLNVALNGDFCHKWNKGGAIHTHKIINVTDWTKDDIFLKTEYISFEGVTA